MARSAISTVPWKVLCQILVLQPKWVHCCIPHLPQEPQKSWTATMRAPCADLWRNGGFWFIHLRPSSDWVCSGFQGVTWLSSRSCAYCQGIRLILCLLSDILICSRSARSGDGEGGRMHYQHMWFIQKIQYSSQHGVSSQLGYLERIVIWWVSYPSLSLIFYSAADDPRPIRRICWYYEGSLLRLKNY